jgi:leucyl-tRNA synthetase
MHSDYRPQEIEPRWQERWARERTHQVRTPGSRPKYYVLEMLPYPSGRLHMGHVRNYTMGDVVARFKRMTGHAVMYAIGWDSLGLPAENAAIEHGVAPWRWTKDNIDVMRAQLRRMGFSYDWSREVASHEPEYYRWNQWFFLKFWEAGLAYRKMATVQWCGRCKTVLANEQVEEGLCYRCDTPVEARELEQWFLRTTKYGDELLAGLDGLDTWPDALRTQQRNWIGRSEGARVRFGVAGHPGVSLEVFTTRLDTIHGCTFVVVAPDHPALDRLGLPPDVRARVAAFARDQARAHVASRGVDAARVGIDTGASAINPYTGEAVPIWTASFVVKEYGTGAVMSVPAHDLRDLDFARTYGLPIRPVVRRPDGVEPEVGYTDDGVLERPSAADAALRGASSLAARAALTARGEREGFAERATVYRLRDWGISRQRYWGTPIPAIHCGACGIVPVPVKDLPVRLPLDMELTGESSPLARHPDFARVRCPRCQGDARREADTMDTFVDSSWYLFRYLDPRNAELPFRPEVVRDWMPVDLYIGGPEHAVGHLIYFRWWARAMREIGLEVPEEPATRLIHHGMVTRATQRCPTHGWRYPEEVVDGRCSECGLAIEIGPSTKMSKSKRNGVEPDEYIARLGADTLRLFSMFTAPPGKEIEWSDAAVEGMHRFLGRLWRLATRPGLREADRTAKATTPAGEALENATHRTIHRVTVDLGERLHLNTGIAAVMELCNAIQDTAPVDAPLPADAGPVRRAVEAALLLLSPYAPHVCEEAWSRLGHDSLLARESWPTHDPVRLVESAVVVAVQVNGKLRGEVELPRDAGPDAAVAAARANDRLARHLHAVDVVKVVHVPNRLLNLVVRPRASAP